MPDPDHVLGGNNMRDIMGHLHVTVSVSLATKVFYPSYIFGRFS